MWLKVSQHSLLLHCIKCLLLYALVIIYSDILILWYWNTILQVDSTQYYLIQGKQNVFLIKFQNRWKLLSLYIFILMKTDLITSFCINYECKISLWWDPWEKNQEKYVYWICDWIKTSSGGWIPGGHLSTCIKMLSYQYRDPHVKDKTVIRPSYL